MSLVGTDIKPQCRIEQSSTSPKPSWPDSGRHPGPGRDARLTPSSERPSIAVSFLASALAIKALVGTVDRIFGINT